MKKQTLLILSLVGTLGILAPTLSANATFSANSNNQQLNTTGTNSTADESEPRNEWVEKNGKRYYYNSKGEMVTGWLTLNNQTYYLNPKDGAMRTGVIKVQKKYYYLNPTTGQQQTGWRTHKNKTYYFEKKHKYAAIGWRTIKKKSYYFDSTGVLLKNKWTPDRQYRTDKDGVRATRFVTLSKHTYYFSKKDGKLVTGRKKILGHHYYFNKKGRMQKDKWIGGRYYESDGKMATNKWVVSKYVNGSGRVTRTRNVGFHTVGKRTYYYDPVTFAMVKNAWHEIDKKWYYFDANGVMAKSKWHENNTMYTDKHGVRITNKFKTIKKVTYLFDTQGTMVKGLTTFKGLTYYLNPTTGARTTGWVVVGDKTYYFQPDKKGAMATDVTLVVSGTSYIFDKTGASNYDSINATKGHAIAKYAQQFIGYPYVYGGATNLTKGVDCSGFTMLVFKHFGLNIPRVAAAQALGTSAWGGPFAPAKFITEKNLMPGDIICYYTPVTHVGIYIGDGKIVHSSNSAPYPAGGIKISNYNYAKITKIVRYW